MKETTRCGRHENETNVFSVSVQIMTGSLGFKDLVSGFVTNPKKWKSLIAVVS
jgi:hypothetical protein